MEFTFSPPFRARFFVPGRGCWSYRQHRNTVLHRGLDQLGMAGAFFRAYHVFGATRMNNGFSFPFDVNKLAGWFWLVCFVFFLALFGKAKTTECVAGMRISTRALSVCLLT